MAKTIKFNLICDGNPVRTIEDLQNNLEKFPNILVVHKQNNGKILEFYALIKNELGIKD